MKKRSTFLKFAEAALFLSLLTVTAIVDARHAKPKMATNIPASITTPDSVSTLLGTLRFFDGFPDSATVKKVYDNLDFLHGVQTFLMAGSRVR